MKLSVCGKGGSGKSAITTLLANGIRDKGYEVLVVDSDESNSGLYRVLGFEYPPVPLLELVGGKSRVKNALSKTASEKSGQEMNIMGRAQIILEDLPPQYIVRRDGISLVSVGKILQALEGCACPMGVLSREFLKKLRLKANEIAIVDMEAGVEHFGRGVETGIDSVLIVVDPSYESIQLAEKIKDMTRGIGVGNTWAILNKVTSNEISSKLREELEKRNVDTIVCIRYDSEIFEAGFEGLPMQSPQTKPEVRTIIEYLLSNIGRDTKTEGVTEPNPG